MTGFGTIVRSAFRVTKAIIRRNDWLSEIERHTMYGFG